ncbi:zinc finger protein aebp2-like isoform X2 [Mizuhopecten yessoensis]|uniref:zinc finger protein aebp2-like isoform X2 n=1 Tax=Mizuhopecten yessoensis TaxID=6573 RepID=UPI000B45DF0A|nr:zinc finger protein aebp2-like isoform X2 [Mizuhopecten yessoensis]
MAAVGCMENSGDNNSEERQDNCVSDLREMCKKNGLNHKFNYEEKPGDCINAKEMILEKLTRINGTNKHNSFTKPSIPTLRSRGERVSGGQDSPRRTRRLSKQDQAEPRVIDCKEEEQETPQCTFPCVDLFSDKNGVSSLSEEKEITRLVEGGCASEQVTPDTSRSCTPLSIGGSCVLSPISKDSRPADTQCSCKETYVACKWKDCDCGLEPPALMDHIRQCHVDTQSGETYVCLWQGCKVYDKSSCSRSWLERHILSHSGDKPFKCIVDGCVMRFTSQKGLERHVNSHFAVQQSNSNRTQKSREDTPTKLWRRKKLKRRRHTAVRTTDFFDSGIIEQLQKELMNFTEHTHIDLNGSSNSVTFHSSVLARRREESGKVKVLLHWSPEDIIPDKWVPESEVPELHTCTIPVRQLPQDTALGLHPSLYRRHRYRKHRRK